MSLKFGIVNFILVLLSPTIAYCGTHYLFASNECNYCTSEPCIPTVLPSKDFNPHSDAQKLHKILKRWRTSQDLLIEILTSRSDYQRLQINQDYMVTGSTLSHDLSGKSMEVLAALAKPLPVFYADELKYAIKTKNYNAMIEILTSLPGCAVREIALTYRMINGVSLYADISKRTWFNFRKVMIELARGTREDPAEPNLKRAKKDAKYLVSAGVNGSWRVRSGKFREILTRRSFPQLKYTVDAYNAIRAGQDQSYVSILKDIETLFTKNVNATYSAIIQNVLDQPGFFAQSLNSTLNGVVTAKDSRKLIRIIRGRCEIDLGDIKGRYQELYMKPLSHCVNEVTFKRVNKCLVAIIEGKNKLL